MNDPNAPLKAGDRFTVTMFGTIQNAALAPNLIGPQVDLEHAIQDVLADKGGWAVVEEPFVVAPQVFSATQNVEQWVEMGGTGGEIITRRTMVVTQTPNEPVMPGDFGGIAANQIADAGLGSDGDYSAFTTALVAPPAIAFLTLAVLIVAALTITGATIVGYNWFQTRQAEIEFYESALEAGVSPGEASSALDSTGLGSVFSGAKGLVLAGAALVGLLAILSATKG